MRSFLQENAEQAAILGWNTLELFGVHPSLGAVRVDCCGALVVSLGSLVVEIGTHLIRYENGLAFRRHPTPAGAVPIWEFGSPGAPPQSPA